MKRAAFEGLSVIKGFASPTLGMIKTPPTSSEESNNWRRSERIPPSHPWPHVFSKEAEVL